jgi:PAS domain S-box-containing protein
LLEEKYVRLDGAVIDVEATTSRLEYQGRLALQTIVRDITEHRRAEGTVRLRLRLFEFAANHSLDELMQKALDEIGEITNSPIGFYHFVEADQNTLSLQAWSTRTLQEFCKAEGKGLHYSIDEAGVWVDCVHQRKPVIQNDYAALPHRKGMPAGHAEVKRELVVPTMREGRIVSILGVGNKPLDYDEKDVELVAYVADVVWNIIERKRAEAQLRDYQRQLEAQNLELRKLSLAIEQSGSTIVITDTTGAIQYANPRFEETTGYTLNEARGQNPRILKSGEQSADFYRVLWDTITGGQIWRGEFHNKRKDGSLYWESATIAPVHDAAGQITNYIGIKEDVTARKQIEEELRQSNAELQARNQELDAFAHTVAHDLKSPVAQVVTSTELLLDAEYPLDDEDRIRTTLSLARAGRKMNSIIQELLLLSQVRKMEVAVEPLDMYSIAQEALLRLQETLTNSQVELAVPAVSEWPSAIGYGPWIEEVWVNYLSNAIKYGAAEGLPPHVELGADPLPNPPPLAGEDKGRGMVRFWVHDNGPGLTAEAQSRLFTPFTRLDQARAHGHGLGLSIARRIVEKLGGQVGVESQLGQGSTFFFTLPAA